MKNLIYRLLFTKSDDMDLSQITLSLLNVFFVVWVVMVGLQKWVISEPMLDAFLVVYATTTILASPTWLAKLWIESKWSFERRGQIGD